MQEFWNVDLWKIFDAFEISKLLGKLLNKTFDNILQDSVEEFLKILGGGIYLFKIGGFYEALNKLLKNSRTIYMRNYQVNLWKRL